VIDPHDGLAELLAVIAIALSLLAAMLLLSTCGEM
jgi:hypothetical protein